MRLEVVTKILKRVRKKSNLFQLKKKQLKLKGISSAMIIIANLFCIGGNKAKNVELFLNLILFITTTIII